MAVDHNYFRFQGLFGVLVTDMNPLQTDGYKIIMMMEQE